MVHSSPGNRSRGSHNEDHFGEPPAKKQKGSHDEKTSNSGRRQAACQACRLRKVKCDKKRPCCAICRASGVVCEYLNDTSDKITLETATHTILERLDNLRQELDSVKQTQYQSNLYNRQQQAAVAAATTAAPQAHTALSLDPQLSIPNNASSTSATLVEPSRDFLRIPPHRASADTVLQWDVFQNKYPPNALVGLLFHPDNSDAPPSSRPAASPSAVPDLPTGSSSVGLTPLDDEQIPALIDRFLTNVYTKNPILDVESLVKHGRKCADSGVGWDGWSCLVLLACALGVVATPFDRSSSTATADATTSGVSNSSARLYAKELQQGDSCFTLACRRLGSLRYSMLGAQCYFFAGVYLMYTLRPIQSWHYFFQASTFTQFYLRMTHGLSDTFAEVLTSPPSHALPSAERKARRIEQSLYWSCFKSECEFRVELPLPQSEISMGEYPQLFPSPPSPVLGTPEPEGGGRDGGGAGVNGSTKTSDGDGDGGWTDEHLELRQHAMRLCNEEESWYYYLTEIALRRIGNRIINTFFPAAPTAGQHTQRPSFWQSNSNIRPLLRMAREFEAQVGSWSAHLPPAMQQYETSSMIRAPHLNYQGEGARSHVSRELSWAIDNRLLEMQTWLYQPFLYYLIHVGVPLGHAHHYPHNHHQHHHHPGSTTSLSEAYTGSPTLESRQAIPNLLNPWSPSTTTGSVHSVDFTSHPVQQQQPQPQQPPGPTTPLDTEDLAVLQSLITSGIECCLKTIDVRARGHRHHGLWFDLRSLMTASLILLAIVKSGNEAWIPGGVEALWGPEEYAPTTASSAAVHTPGNGCSLGGKRMVGGRLKKVFARMEFWAGEAPDMLRYMDVLEEVIRDIRGP